MSGTALIFPGQGSQYVGMGKKIHDRFEVVRNIFEEANDTLGFDLKKLCFEGSLDDLTKTENTQPAILTMSYASFKVFMQESNIRPRCLAGHSLGEISALSCSGAIRFADALRIVRARGRFMQEAVPLGAGAMVAVNGLGVREIEEVCYENSTNLGIVVVSNYNTPSQTVVSGHAKPVEKVSEIFNKKGATVIPLKVSAPFHSPIMDIAAVKLKEELIKYQYMEMQYPVLSNVTAKPYPSMYDIPEYLCRQLKSPVMWTETMDYLCNEGITRVVEIGPGKVLSNMIRNNYTNIKPFSFDNDEDYNEFLTLCSNESIQLELKEMKFKFMTRCLAIAVCTKNINWDNDEYQKGVVEPYRAIHNLVLEIENEDREPTDNEVKLAFDMLKSVFNTKFTPINEQEDRFNQLFNETGIRIDT